MFAIALEICSLLNVRSRPKGARHLVEAAPRKGLAKKAAEGSVLETFGAKKPL